jgi:hypothetical protein
MPKPESSLETRIENEAAELVTELIESLEEAIPYKDTVEAARILDDAAEDIAKLEQLLVEYDGRPIYTGDCKYLEEARI